MHSNCVVGSAVPEVRIGGGVLLRPHDCTAYTATGRQHILLGVLASAPGLQDIWCVWWLFAVAQPRQQEFQFLRKH
jgi:hypothetical protein